MGRTQGACATARKPAISAKSLRQAVDIVSHELAKFVEPMLVAP
jgi:hypothetical protein